MAPLQVIHLTSWLSRRGGGIPPVIWGLVRGGKKTGFESLVAGGQDDFVEADCECPDARLILSRISRNPFLKTLPELESRLISEVLPNSIIHNHGLWTHSGLVARNVSRATRSPMMISPHGMLDAWALRRSAWKKRLMGWALEKRNLRAAACLHALCDAEAFSIRQYGLQNPICVVPNGVDLPTEEQGRSLEVVRQMAELKSEGRRILLYLGRLHPKKGLVNLLKGWKMALDLQEALKSKWSLAIAGWDQEGHESELKTLVADERLDGSVLFLGPQFGEAKAVCYRNSDAFVLPSFSEGVPMSVLEAWSYGKPVLMTPQCNLPEGFAAGAAIRIETDKENIARALSLLGEMEDRECQEIGACGVHLCQERFSWERVAHEMRGVYDWMLGNCSAPESVRLH